jgi:hypothetical protein
MSHNHLRAADHHCDWRLEIHSYYTGERTSRYLERQSTTRVFVASTTRQVFSILNGSLLVAHLSSKVHALTSFHSEVDKSQNHSSAQRPACNKFDYGF